MSDFLLDTGLRSHVVSVDVIATSYHNYWLLLIMITGDRQLGKLCAIMEKICHTRWFWWWWHWGGWWDGWQWGWWGSSLCQVSSRPSQINRKFQSTQSICSPNCRKPDFLAQTSDTDVVVKFKECMKLKNNLLLVFICRSWLSTCYAQHESNHSYENRAALWQLLRLSHSLLIKYHMFIWDRSRAT